MDVNFILFRYDTSDLQIVSGSVKACELQYPISDNLISTQIKSLSDDFEKAAILNLVFFWSSLLWYLPGMERESALNRGVDFLFLTQLLLMYL